jgi:DNA-binding NarL/FixJ family response regulator
VHENGSKDVTVDTKVMIVDDHWIVREGLFVSLNRHSRLRVVGTASSGEEAIVAAPRLAPDLIIMDVVLPGLDGIDAAQRILREAPQIHVIVLSACRSFEQVQRALRAGIGAYVLKAAAFEEIVLAVESVLSGRQYVSPDFQALLVGGLAEAAMPPCPIDRLSERERAVLRYIAGGMTSSGIAKIMSLSRKTVDTYRSRMMTKLGVDSRSALIRVALKYELPMV